jgi:hypothetical protein
VNPHAPSYREPGTYFFSRRELERLAVYRAAIIARFYTDQCEPVSMRFGNEAVRLLESVRRDLRAAA